MDASQILDVIEAKYSNLPLLREISTIDEQGTMDNNLRGVEPGDAAVRWLLNVRATAITGEAA